MEFGFDRAQVDSRVRALDRVYRRRYRMRTCGRSLCRVSRRELGAHGDLYGRGLTDSEPARLQHHFSAIAATTVWVRLVAIPSFPAALNGSTTPFW